MDPQTGRHFFRQWTTRCSDWQTQGSVSGLEFTRGTLSPSPSSLVRLGQPLPPNWPLCRHLLDQLSKTSWTSSQPGQRIWSPSKDLPFQVESSKQAPRFIRPFEVDSIVNPLAVLLKLPSSLKVCPTFHVCLPKLVLSPTSSRLLSLLLPCCRRPGVHHLDFGRLLTVPGVWSRGAAVGSWASHPGQKSGKGLLPWSPDRPGLSPGGSH